MNAVREDPASRGLLFAGTEFGIYISFDDGDHWQPLQLNLPATSVRDMAFHGDDLLIATHGRSFWILDDITALRQVKDAEKAANAWLYRPGTVTRVDNDSFQGTPIPPDEPLANNPPKGAILDYYVARRVDHVKIEIFDSNHELVRSYSSDDTQEQKLIPRPVADRWLPKVERVESSAGMHRLVWNLAWATTGTNVGGSEEYGLHGPHVIPGDYDVKLTVDGNFQTQPLHVVMDPRSSATAQELDHQYRLGRQIYADAISTNRAIVEIGAIQKQIADIASKIGDQHPDLKTSAGVLQARLAALLNVAEGAPNSSMGLERAAAQLGSALGVVESGDRAVPSQAVAAYDEASQTARSRLAQWKQCQVEDIPKLDDELRKAGFDTVHLSGLLRTDSDSFDTDAN